MTLFLVIPCYNEQEVLPETAKRLKEKMAQLRQSGKINSRSRICFVDDGSKDDTWSMIQQLHTEDELFQGIKLSRNQGHQNALLAGLMTVREACDAAISMDADLQDDIDAIDKMVDAYLAGNDIVYGVRSDRKKDSAFKRGTAQLFYKLMKCMGADIIYNHADYRLMSRRALDGLSQFKEVNLFLRGIVPMVGYKSTQVYYSRGERFAGKTKYPFKKMLAFAFEGISSLSIRPVRMISTVGILMFLISIGILIYSLVQHLLGATVQGWTSLAVSMWAIGGLQLLAIGIIGEYIGKIYLESKQRPRFIVEEYLK